MIIRRSISGMRGLDDELFEGEDCAACQWKIYSVENVESSS